MKRINDISYAPHHGFRGLGDLFLPGNAENAAVALVIHGGGWNAMDKTSITPVAVLLAQSGIAAFSINYRLLKDAPWPACAEDCVSAAEFVLSAGHPAFQGLDLSSIFVIGASAGGHLALHTGLMLAQGRVRGIVSIAGPSDALAFKQSTPEAEKNVRLFFGTDHPDEAFIRSAAPVHLPKRTSPPLLCIHSVNDRLVPPSHSEAMVEAYRKAGACAELFRFDGKGTFHGIWEDQGGEVNVDQRMLVGPVQEAVKKFFAKR